MSSISSVVQIKIFYLMTILLRYNDYCLLNISVDIDLLFVELMCCRDLRREICLFKIK